MKNLIIYFSRRGQNYAEGNVVNLVKGNTEIIVEYIRKAVSADVFEVVPANPYPADYYDCTRQAKQELNEKARPALKRTLTDIGEYDNIVVAGPCWWGTFPCPVLTQLEALSWTGKKVFPVITHEGSGLSNAPSSLRQLCKGAFVGNGLAVHGKDVPDAQAKVAEWAIRNLL